MQPILKYYSHLANDSLYRNSIYLMLSTGVMAFLGFFFWIINAKLFSPEQIGVATTLISVMTLISTFSLLGLGNSLIKYLPETVQKNEMINISFILVCLTSIFITVFFLVFLETFSPLLLFVKENIFLAILFISFIVFASLNLISEFVFIAYRSSKYVLVKNIVWSFTKLILPFFVISLGSYGIFLSVGISMFIACLISLFFLIYQFDYLVKPQIDQQIVKRTTKFSLGNYLALFIGNLPSLILPLLITNSIGARFSAFFYIDMMIANLLYIVPLATSQSLFAEGVYSSQELKKNLKKAIKIIAILLVPAIIVTFIFGKYLLLAFGKEYSEEGTTFLQILAVSGIFLAINHIGNSLLFIKHQLKLIVLINITGVFLTFILSIFPLSQNLTGIGFAWIIGYGTSASIYLILFKKFLSIN